VTYVSRGATQGSKERRKTKCEVAVLDTMLRTYKDSLLRPVAARLGTISPNLITVLAAVAGLAAAGAAAWPLYGLALALWLLNRILDGLDGVVARDSNRQSDFGGYLDIVLDFVVYASIPIGIYFGAPTALHAVTVILLLGAFYVNGASWIYLSAILEKRQVGANARGELTTITMPNALIGGTETILFYTAFLIWPGQFAWLALLMALLVLLGVGQRVLWARRHLAPPTRAPQIQSPQVHHSIPSET
jgi:phosphatidylglycerophosphate synthase